MSKSGASKSAASKPEIDGPEIDRPETDEPDRRRPDPRETARVLTAQAEEIARLDAMMPAPVRRILGAVASLARLPARLRRSARRLTGRLVVVPPGGAALDRAYRSYRRAVVRHDRIRGTGGDAALARLAHTPLISVIGAAPGGQIYEAVETVATASEATGTWRIRLAPGDRLAPDALVRIAEAAALHPAAQVIFGDEDRIGSDGQPRDPWFKPAFNPELMFACNAMGRPVAVRADRLETGGGVDAPALWSSGSDHALALAAVAGLRAEAVVHVPRVLLSRAPAPADDRLAADRDAVAAHLAQALPGARITDHPALAGCLQIDPALPEALPLVSVLIPTRNGARVLARCLETLHGVTRYPRLEVVIADNGSDDPAALDLLDSAATRPDTRVIRIDAPFNYAALNNRMAAEAGGSVLVLMNNDIEIRDPDWVRKMLGWALAPGCGPVGAALHYPTGTLQHGGIVLGMAAGPGHAHHHLPDGHSGVHGRAVLTQRVSAVTGALLMIRRDLWDTLSGMDADTLAVTFNDVDLGLRAARAGCAPVWVPQARFIHHESATRGRDRTPDRVARFRREAAHMERRWAWEGIEDPFYNPNLSRQGATFALAQAPRDLTPRTATPPHSRTHTPDTQPRHPRYIT